MNTLEKILSLEWDMFHNVNGQDRTSCQDDYDTFCKMRSAQFSVWSVQTVESYLSDLEQANAQGINLMRIKYIYMMKNTDPAGYEKFRCELPADDPEKLSLIDAIWDIQLRQTEQLRDRYPIIALGGRPLLASTETDYPSVETYQKGELMTYSAATLRNLLSDINDLEKQSVSYALKVQENSVLCMGYSSLDEAEQAMAMQLLQQMGAGSSDCAGGCCCTDF